MHAVYSFLNRRISFSLFHKNPCLKGWENRQERWRGCTFELTVLEGVSLPDDSEFKLLLTLQCQMKVKYQLQWCERGDWIGLKYTSQKVMWTCLVVNHHPIIFLGFLPRNASCKRKIEQEKEDIQGHCLPFLIMKNSFNGLLATFHSLQLTYLEH